MRDHVAWGDEQAPLGEYEWEHTRIVLAQIFHWQLDYIDSLSHGQVNRIFGDLAGQHEGEEMKRA